VFVTILSSQALKDPLIEGGETAALGGSDKGLLVELGLGRRHALSLPAAPAAGARDGAQKSAKRPRVAQPG
jgi:hypothetical protein